MAAPFVASPVPTRKDPWGPTMRSARAALIELENVLARAPRIRDVPEDVRSAVDERFNVDLRLVMSGELEALFNRYLEHSLDADRISDDEVAELVHLSRILGISDRRARELHDAAAGAVYHLALEDRLSRFEMRPDHEAFLAELREALLLSDAHVERIHHLAAMPVLEHAESLALGDTRLSPDEEAELEALASRFGLRWPTARSDRERLDRLRRYWRADNETLPVLNTSIALLPGEQVHYMLKDVTWTAGRRGLEPFASGAAKLRSLLRRIIPSRLQPSAPARLPGFEPWTFDTGDLYLSNHHLHFDGDRRRRTLPLLRIVRVRPGDGRLAIERVARGPTVVLELRRDADRTFVLLTRLIREARWRRVYRPLAGRGPDATPWEPLGEHEGDVRER